MTLGRSRKDVHKPRRVISGIDANRVDLDNYFEPVAIEDDRLL
jgi:hypothetical protein